jgi:DNA-binding NarL/FixJ family response regulator
VGFHTHSGLRRVENRPVPSTVLIVDDHPGFRASAKRLLTSHGYTVVGEAANGSDALDAVLALEPELVLLDLGLPDSDGVEIAHHLNERHPDAIIVLVSSRDRMDVEPLLAGAPARGFIPKAELSAAALDALLR